MFVWACNTLPILLPHGSLVFCSGRSQEVQLHGESQWEGCAFHIFTGRNPKMTHWNGVPAIFVLSLCCQPDTQKTVRVGTFWWRHYWLASLVGPVTSVLCCLFLKKKYVRAGCQWDRCAIRDGAAWPPLNTWQWHDLLAASWTQQVQLDEEAEWRQDEVDTAGHLGRRTPIYHSRQSSSDANGLSVLSPCMMNFDPV